MADMTMKQYIQKNKPALIDLIYECGAECGKTTVIFNDQDYPELEFSVTVTCRRKATEYKGDE